MKKIKVINNFFDESLHRKTYQYAISSTFKYGERDKKEHPPVGMVYEITYDDPIISKFDKPLKEKVPALRDLKLYRSYINCFAPGEKPYFHKDLEKPGGYTALYYPNLTWDINDGGETQFDIDNAFYGIKPKPNSMVVFAAELTHKATTFRDSYRFTFAFKYK